MSSLTGGSSLGTADIIGLVIGGVLALATIVGLACTCYAMCCRKKNPPQVWPQQNQYDPYHPSNGRGAGGYGQPMNTGYYQQYPPYQQQQQPVWNKQSNYNEQPPVYSSAIQQANSFEKY